MKDIFGEEREVSLIRELTKIHEEVIHGTLKEITSTTLEEKGECVIVVQGETKKESLSDDEVKKLLKAGLKEGKTLSVLAKEIASSYPISKNEVYRIGLEMKK